MWLLYLIVVLYQRFQQPNFLTSLGEKKIYRYLKIWETSLHILIMHLARHAYHLYQAK